MTVTATQILGLLPPDQDKWILVKEKQYVNDIMKDICTAHKLYGHYYDAFSYLFYDSDVDEIGEKLYRFCKNNIQYSEESVHSQTTAIPTGILNRGYGDCKHYALFVSGVLASLNRMYGMGIKWYYCFAGYGEAKEPYHVFVALDLGNEELWIDPTPGAGGEPSVLIRKECNG
jgi:hypothetical protein